MLKVVVVAYAVEVAKDIGSLPGFGETVGVGRGMFLIRPMFFECTWRGWICWGDYFILVGDSEVVIGGLSKMSHFVVFRGIKIG